MSRRVLGATFGRRRPGGSGRADVAEGVEGGAATVPVADHRNDAMPAPRVKVWMVGAATLAVAIRHRPAE